MDSTGTRRGERHATARAERTEGRQLRQRQRALYGVQTRRMVRDSQHQGRRTA